MENVSTTTAGNDGLVQAARTTRSVLKGLSGVIALSMGAALVTSGLALAVLLGGLALYTGGRQVFESGKELLTLKAQSALSTLFTGKPLTEITPVKQPKTPLGKIFRVAEYVNLAVTGAGAFAAAGFAIGMGSQSADVARLLLGGVLMGVSGVVNTGAEAVKGIRSLFRAQAQATAPDVTRPVQAPDPSPAPALTSKATAPAFNQTSAPAAAPDSAPAAEAPKVDAPKPPTV